jgi:hypothetical protein
LSLNNQPTTQYYSHFPRPEQNHFEARPNRMTPCMAATVPEERID